MRFLRLTLPAAIRRRVVITRNGFEIRSSTRISTPPLHRLKTISRFFYSTKTNERVFEPMQSDLTHEWVESVKCGEMWRARYIRWVRGPLMFWATFVLQAPWSLLKKIKAIYRGEGA
jgi:hypothetical protein